MSTAAFLIAAFTVATAAFVQGIIGVGFALIAVPVLAVVAPESLPVCVLVLMIPLNIYVVWRERAALDWQGTGWISTGRVAGTFLGVLVLLALAPQQLGLLIGAAILLAAVVTFFKPAFTPNSRIFLAAGLVTGITETATGIGGPPLALVYQHKPGPVIRATLAMCFLIGQIVSLAALLAAQHASFNQVLSALVLMPAVFMGALASHTAHRHIQGHHLRSAVMAFSLASGIVLILRGLT